MFDTWRFHTFFATATDLDTVGAGNAHRQHAIIEQVHADLKNSALAHLPSKSFAANAAWLVCAVMAFDLTRAAGTLTDVPQSHHRHDPADPSLGPGADRVLRTAVDVAPVERLALGKSISQNTVAEPRNRHRCRSPPTTPWTRGHATIRRGFSSRLVSVARNWAASAPSMMRWSTVIV